MLPRGWSLEHAPDGYVYAGLLTPAAEAEMWRVVHFLAYQSLAALRLVKEGPEGKEYELVSATREGVGFRARFVFRRG